MYLTKEEAFVYGMPVFTYSDDRGLYRVVGCSSNLQILIGRNTRKPMHRVEAGCVPNTMQFVVPMICIFASG